MPKDGVVGTVGREIPGVETKLARNEASAEYEVG